MAILVLIDRDATHSDPTKDARGCYKLGDIVAVHDDSRYTDGEPIAPPWYLIRITGVTKAQVVRLLEPVRDTLDPQTSRVLRRRRWRVNPADLPPAVRTTLQRDRYLSVTLAQARNYVRDKLGTDTL